MSNDQQRKTYLIHHRDCNDPSHGLSCNYLRIPETFKSSIEEIRVQRRDQKEGGQGAREESHQGRQEREVFEVKLEGR